MVVYIFEQCGCSISLGFFPMMIGTSGLSI